MKKLTAALLGAIITCLLFNSCSLDYDFTEEDLKNQYFKHWILTYGLIDPDQDWNMATRITAQIDPSVLGNGGSIYIYTDHPLTGGMLIGRTSVPGDIGLDVVQGTDHLYIRNFNADSSAYRDCTVAVVDGVAVVRDVASRADNGSDFGEWVTVSEGALISSGTQSYHWILACEDLGSTGDTDFNDIVLGMTYVSGDNPQLTITPLACGGTLPADVYYKDRKLFEIHERFGVPTSKMHNTSYFAGPAEAKVITGSELDGFSITDKMGGISLLIHRGDGDQIPETIISPSEHGVAPAIICVPGNWEWPTECTSIHNAYPGFTDWSQDKTLSDWMSKKTPRAVVERPNELTNNLTQRTITVNGVERTYLLYVPSTVEAYPALVVSLHGANNHAQEFMPFKTDYAETAKCIVAYPQGQGQNFPIFGSNPVPGWDADAGNDGAYVLKNTADEKFLRAMLDDIAKAYKYDSKRVYCCGFSNGGMMTYAASVVMSDIFAAFASVSGLPVNEFHHYTWGPRPVPFMHIHGKDDTMVRYELLPIVRDCMVARNGCNPVPQISGETGQYTKKVYKGISGRTFDYTTIEVEGLGHYYASANLENWNTSKVLWEFFKDYTLDSPCDNTFAWGLNVDATGFDASAQGWDMEVNAAKTRYTFGHTDRRLYSTTNAYPSVQLVPGWHKLTYNTTGSADDKVYIQLVALNDDNNIKLIGHSQVGTQTTVYFRIWSYVEYKLIIAKENAADKFTSFEITRCDDEGTAQNFTPINAASFPADGHLVEVPQAYPTGQPFGYCDHSTSDGVTTYTTNSTSHNIAFKMTDIDATDCDYVLIKFAEPVLSGWQVGFWSGQANVGVPAGSTEYRINIPTDQGEETMTYQNGGRTYLNQICLLRLWWGEGNAPQISCKVEGVYLHCTRIGSHSH